MTFTKKSLLRKLLWLLSVISLLFLRGEVLAQVADRDHVSQASTEWATYTLKKAEFSVALPLIPAMSAYEEKADPFEKRVLRYLVGAYSRGVGYSIQIFERRQSLDDFISGLRYPPTRVVTRDIKIGKVSGKEFVSQNDFSYLTTRFFDSPKYIYVFQAHAVRLLSSDADVSKFFESVRFEEDPTGLAIVAGSGDLPPNADRPLTDEKIFTGKEVDRKASVVTKPEPAYTEAARRNQIAGTVVIRGVFTSDGVVSNIRVLSGLEHGLTEQAIEALRRLRFIPAVKNGKFVSMWIQLEYNFNLY